MDHAKPIQCNGAGEGKREGVEGIESKPAVLYNVQREQKAASKDSRFGVSLRCTPSPQRADSIFKMTTNGIGLSL
jgi:hypothetical protein